MVRIPTVVGNQRGMALLDALFILFSACTLLLFMLWLAFALIGNPEQLNELPDWIKDAVSSVWTWLTGGASAILLGWLQQRNRTDEPQPRFMLWILGTSVALIVSVVTLAMTIQWLSPVPEPDGGADAAPGVEDFELSFRLALPPNDEGYFLADQLAIKQRLPKTRDWHNIVLQDNGLFVERVDFPGPGENYIGRVKRRISASFRDREDTPIDAQTELCFVRAPNPPQDLEPKGILDCQFGNECTVPGEDPGWLRSCDAQTLQRPDPLGWFPSAYADTGRGNWVVPALDVLQSKQFRTGTGYSRFQIDARLVAPVDADHLIVRVQVNGTPVLFDGLQPEEIAKPYGGSTTLRTEFGLENLNFRGADAGRDHIGLGYEFVRNGAPVKTYQLTLRHVALRPAPAQTIRAEDGSEFIWQTDYQAAEQEAEFEVFIFSPTQPGQAERRRQALERCELVDDSGHAVRGVVRPPLTTGHYGVSVGLEQGSGQIRFTFTQAEAKALQDWIAQESVRQRCPDVFRDGSFLYRIKGQ